MSMHATEVIPTSDALGRQVVDETGRRIGRVVGLTTDTRRDLYRLWFDDGTTGEWMTDTSIRVLAPGRPAVARQLGAGTACTDSGDRMLWTSPPTDMARKRERYARNRDNFRQPPGLQLAGPDCWRRILPTGS